MEELVADSLQCFCLVVHQVTTLLSEPAQMVRYLLLYWPIFPIGAEVFVHAQERDIIDSIQDYFKHEIPSLDSTDEDRFIAVLHDAGLTDENA